MLKVDPVRASVSFYKQVTVPGRRYLREHPEARGKLLPNLWNACRNDVYRAYHGICAYLAVYLVEAAGYEVDHYIPKSRNAQLAFQWSNLRLSSSHANKKKWAHHVCDPFTLPVGAFEINFLTGRILVSRRLPKELRIDLSNTIRILDLNSQAARATRFQPYAKYKRGSLDVETLTNWYPFAAFEMMRQGRLKPGDGRRCASVLRNIGYASVAGKK